MKKLYSKSNLEEKTLSLYGYHHDYAVLRMHTKNYLLLILFHLTFASVALKVSIKSEVLSLLVGCFVGTKTFMVKKTLVTKFVREDFLLISFHH